MREDGAASHGSDRVRGGSCPWRPLWTPLLPCPAVDPARGVRCGLTSCPVLLGATQ